MLRLLTILALITAQAAAQTSTRASLGLAGDEGNDISYSPSISADGRFVAFETGATNLIPGDSNGNKDVLVRDLLLGVTAVVSVNSAGDQGSPGTGSHQPDTSSDGRYVAFHSFAPNFGSLGDVSGVSDIFLRDRDPDEDGLYDEANSTTVQVSLTGAGTQPNGGSYNVRISGDGTVVAFESAASNLVVEGGPSGAGIFVRDLDTGINELVAKDLLDLPVNASLQDLSRDGRHVVYSSNDPDIVTGDTNGFTDVFVHDRLLGTTVRISVDSFGAEGSNWSRDATLSEDGRYVAFFTKVGLVPTDTDFVGDMYLRDRDPDENGLFDEGNGTTTLVSVNSFGVQTEGAIGETYAPFVSDDGRFVAFSGGDSSGSCCDLVVEDTDGTFDVFLRDLETGLTTRMSVTDDGKSLGGKSWAPSLSADGSLVAFGTWSALDGADTNTHEDIYVRNQTLWRDIGWNMAGTIAPFPAPPDKSVPVLTGSGALTAGSSGALELVQTTKGATSHLFVGLANISAGFKGGTLVPSPSLLISPLAVSTPGGPFGGWTLAFTWPGGVPSGAVFYFQVWVEDVAGPFGLVSSNGLSATTP